MRLLFMGTPEFARAHLEALLDAGHEVCAVVTQEDKPVGRKHVMTPPPVAQCAKEHLLPLYQMPTLKNGALLGVLEKHNPSLIVVVAYGKLLPPYVLDFPPLGCINVHGSLLPRYRGAAPVQRAIIEGETVTGVTVMYMDRALDTGDMIVKESCTIDDTDDTEALFAKLTPLGCRALLRAMEQIESGTAVREKQNDEEATYAAMLDAETGHIDWSCDSRTIHNLVRGTHPWPSAYTFYKGTKIKITQAVPEAGAGEGGKVLSSSPKDGLVVACGSGALRILRLQAFGGKEMETGDYLRGHAVPEGEYFGF